LRDYFINFASGLSEFIDFVYLSGLLRRITSPSYRRHRRALAGAKVFGNDSKLQPAAIIGLIGSVSYEEDVAFYQRLSAQCEAPLLLMATCSLITALAACKNRVLPPVSA
jgi:hypothetical protein